MAQHTLHPSRSGTPECEKMFDKLGYGTLQTYYDNTSVEGCEGRGKQIFRNYMSKVGVGTPSAPEPTAAAHERRAMPAGDWRAAGHHLGGRAALCGQ